MAEKQEEYTNALRAGTRLDTYEIEKVLGAGGFGVTYLAREVNLGKYYAVKELLPDGIAVRQAGEATVRAKSSGNQDDFEATRKYFISEARILAGMSHPAVVGVHRLMEANGTCYMVMDYVEGETLGDYLKKHGGTFRSKAEFERIFYPLMSGLDLLHSQGIIHRDIKPGNIMVQPDGSPVLLDFGAATQTQGKTVTITQMLSAGYSPFEQYTSRAKQGPYTDIYALGATMHKCITGEKPDDASDRVYDDGYKALAKNKEYLGAYGKSVLSAVDKALLMDAKKRPQGVDAWREMMTPKGDASSPDRVNPPPFPKMRGADANATVSPKVPQVLEEPQPPLPSPAPIANPNPDPVLRALKLKRWKKVKSIMTAVLISSALLFVFGVIMVVILGEGENKGRQSSRQIDPRMEALKIAQGLFASGRSFPSDFFDKVDKDDLKALAQEGNVDAQFLWGRVHSSSVGLQNDDREAVKWYRKAAEQEDARAQNCLGEAYFFGMGVGKNKAEGVKLIRKAAEQGYAESQYNLGLMYAEGMGVIKDDREAVKWYRKAAEQGLASAQNYLGVMYSYGRGVGKDRWEAAKWSRKAADQGHAWGQYNTGYSYLYGIGVEKNEEMAKWWLQKVVGNTDPDAKKAAEKLWAERPK
ncbi:MAG: SEL1-like repeat protein [Akkermansiaceae bacterium]|nr:SEL1-like repeat protein [Akkermansiaceae bacterium]